MVTGIIGRNFLLPQMPTQSPKIILTALKHTSSTLNIKNSIIMKFTIQHITGLNSVGFNSSCTILSVLVAPDLDIKPAA
jgi:hypothetical protein